LFNWNGGQRIREITEMKLDLERSSGVADGVNENNCAQRAGGQQDFPRLAEHLSADVIQGSDEVKLGNGMHLVRLRRLTFDMRGGRQLAKPDVGRPLDGRVRRRFAAGGTRQKASAHTF